MPAGDVQGDHRGRWMALIAALLGWLFDGFEIGMFPLVGHHALADLLQDEIAVRPTVATEWFGVIMSTFLIGAATGGVLFGWLGDRVGRVRAMSLSIFTYAVFTGLCAFATEAWHIAVLRFIASLGMGGEWSLGVALVIELWPERSRAVLAGLIGAAANVGILIVGLLSLVLVSFMQGVGEALHGMGLDDRTVELLLAGQGWRLLMIAGSLPALLIFFIRLFVPESPKWQVQRDAGGASHWATRDLAGVLIGAAGAGLVIFLWSPTFEDMVCGTTAGLRGPMPQAARILQIAGSVLGPLAALIGFIYPVAQYLRRAEHHGKLQPGDRGKYVRRMLLGACLAGVALLGTWGSLQWAPKWAIALSSLPTSGGGEFAKEYTQIAMALGAIVGTILAALIGDWIGRRKTYFLLCVGSFASLVYLYQANDAYGAKFLASAAVAGSVTAAFYGWFPLYLPELFPTSIRATSQGFAYNFGRVLSAIGSLHTATLTSYFSAGVPAERVEVDGLASAGATLAAIYLIGGAIIWLGPETKGRPLPD